MLVTIYHMIKKGEPYRELGANFVANHEQKRTKDALVMQLQKLGYSVSLTEVA